MGRKKQMGGEKKKEERREVNGSETFSLLKVKL